MKKKLMSTRWWLVGPPTLAYQSLINYSCDWDLPKLINWNWSLNFYFLFAFCHTQYWDSSVADASPDRPEGMECGVDSIICIVDWTYVACAQSPSKEEAALNNISLFIRPTEVGVNVNDGLNYVLHLGTQMIMMMATEYDTGYFTNINIVGLSSLDLC